MLGSQREHRNDHSGTFPILEVEPWLSFIFHPSLEISVDENFVDESVRSLFPCSDVSILVDNDIFVFQRVENVVGVDVERPFLEPCHLHLHWFFPVAENLCVSANGQPLFFSQSGLHNPELQCRGVVIEVGQAFLFVTGNYVSVCG